MEPTTDELSPSTAINDGNHGPLVRVTTAFCTALMLLSLCARLQIRWPWKSLFGRDDICAVVASAFALTQMTVVLYAVSTGFGKMPTSLSGSSIESVNKAVFASDILFVVALFLAKLAVALLYRRLSSDPSIVGGARVLVAATVLCAIIATVLVTIPASSRAPWNHEVVTADAKVACWTAVTALSILVEIGLVAFPVWLVKGLQMRRTPKILICLAAWLRLPLMPIAIFRLLELQRKLPSENFTFEYSSVEIFTQVEMTLALLAATTICLHKFLRFANSGGVDMTVGTGGVVSNLYGTGNSSTGGRSKERAGKRQSKGFENVKLTSLGRRNTSSAMRSDSHSIASDSSQRNIMVRHTVDVQYGRPEVREVPVETRPDGKI